MMLSTVIDKIVVFRDRVEITFKISLNRFLVNKGSHSNNDALPTELMPQTNMDELSMLYYIQMTGGLQSFLSTAFDIDVDNVFDGANGVIQFGS